MSITPRSARTTNEDVFSQLSRLRLVYGDDLCAELLGITRVKLSHSSFAGSVVRAIQYLHLITFPPTGPVRLIDVLTSGRYARTPQEPVACGAEIVVSGVDGDGI